jgi:hypothetical protein
MKSILEVGGHVQGVVAELVADAEEALGPSKWQRVLQWMQRPRNQPRCQKQAQCKWERDLGFSNRYHLDYS